MNYPNNATITSHEPRVRGGCSLHAAHDPSKCPRTNSALDGRCGVARCVDCCGQVDDHDIDECARCGHQQMVACYFDEEYS